MRVHLLVLLVAAAVTYVLTPVVRRVGLRVGAVKEIRDRDVHVVPIPRLGGLAMLGGLWAATAVASQLPLLRTVFHNTGDPMAVLSGATLVCLLGVADDLWELDAVTKLAGQVLAAGVMVLQGIQVLRLPFGGDLGQLTLPPAGGVLLTVVIIVVTINAVNIVDGLDGLAAGIVAIAGLALFLYLYLLSVRDGLDRATTPTMFAAILVGMCLGFLPHNFFPARIFMGDSGAMLLGLVLSASTISLTGQVQIPGDIGISAVLPILVPILVLLVPLVDLLSAVVRRTRAGLSPFSADKAHLHHRLLQIGHSHPRSVLILYFWSGAVSFSAVASAWLHGVELVLVVVGAFTVAALVTVNLGRLVSAVRGSPGGGGTGDGLKHTTV